MKIRKSGKIREQFGDIMMDYKNVILNKLLDKYEKSKSSYAESNRRIILKMQELKEYDIENFERKSIFHDIVYELADEQIIKYSWKKYEERKYIARVMAN